MKRRTLVAAGLVLPALRPAMAQEAYPSKPVQIFVPFPPGGVADITARPLAHVMGRLAKQSIVVVNKPGAGGSAFAERKKPGFKEELQALVDAVKARKPAAEIAEQQKALIGKVEATAAIIPATERQSAAFASRVAVYVLKVANEEYEAAIENGKIANAVEYQDSRGFVAAGKAYLRRNEKALKAKDAQAYDAIVKAFTDLGKAYPGIMPPVQPKITAGEFQAATSRIELQASRFH